MPFSTRNTHADHRSARGLGLEASYFFSFFPLDRELVGSQTYQCQRTTRTQHEVNNWTGWAREREREGCYGRDQLALVLRALQVSQLCRARLRGCCSSEPLSRGRFAVSCSAESMATHRCRGWLSAVMLPMGTTRSRSAEGGLRYCRMQEAGRPAGLYYCAALGALSFGFESVARQWRASGELGG